MKFIRSQFDKTELRILGVCSALAAFLAYCLVADITFFYSAHRAMGSNNELLASVAEIASDVKYSPSHLPIWEESYAEQKLYRKDKLFTNHDALARVMFIEGIEFIIEENSLVIIDRVENMPSVNILRGRITAKIGSSSSQIQILNNGKRINLLSRSSDVRIEVRNNKERVTSLSGVTLYNINDKMVQLEPGESYGDLEDESVATSPSSSQSKENAADAGLAYLVELAKVAPTKLTSLTTLQTQKGRLQHDVTLRWQKDNLQIINNKLGYLTYEVELSPDVNFNKVIRKNLNNTQNNATITNLKPNAYYWRIRTILPDGSKGEWSSVTTFTLNPIQATPPVAQNETEAKTPKPQPIPTPGVPIIPEAVFESAKVQIKASKITLPAPNVYFPMNQKVMDIQDQRLEWNAVPEAAGYKVEIFSYKNPTQPIKTLDPKLNRIADLKLKPGKYLWRVATVSKDEIITYGPKNTFTVKDIAALKALEALRPDPNDHITTSQIAIVVDFEWFEDRKAKYYIIEASLSEQFLTTFFSRRVDEPKTNFNFPKGTFYWRVTSYDENEKPLKVSAINRFSIAETMGTPKFYGDPSIRKSLGKSEKKSDIELSWSQIPQADRYDVEIASDAEFTQSQLANSQVETNISLTLGHGRYFARVRAVDLYGFSSEWSEVKPIDVVSANLEVGPELILPKKGAQFIYRKGNTAVAFRWKSMKSSQKYDLQIAKDDAFNNVIFSEESPKNEFIAQLPEGDYFWRVRGEDKKGLKTAWSESQNFAINRESSSVTLQYPTASKKIVSFSPKFTRLSFRWEAPKDLTIFTIVVARDKNFTDILASQSIKENRVATLDLPTRGELYWLVEGKSAKEDLVVRSEPSNFIIVSPEENRVDRRGFIGLGIRPVVSQYQTDGSRHKAQMISGAAFARFWITSSLGLGISIQGGQEQISPSAYDQKVSYTQMTSQFDLLFRQHLFGDTSFHFDFLGQVGLKNLQLPQLSHNTDSNSPEMLLRTLRFLNIGLGLERSLSEYWSIAVRSILAQPISKNEAVQSATNFVLMVNLQQKISQHWLLSYGYQYETLRFKTEEKTVSSETERASNAVEVSIGRGF